MPMGTMPASAIALCRALRMPTATTPATPSAINYFEWCQDHNKPLRGARPFGDVAGGGPVTLPDPNIFANGAVVSAAVPISDRTQPCARSACTGTHSPSGTVGQLANR